MGSIQLFLHAALQIPANHNGFIVNRSSFYTRLNHMLDKLSLLFPKLLFPIII